MRVWRRYAGRCSARYGEEKRSRPTLRQDVWRADASGQQRSCCLAKTTMVSENVCTRAMLLA